MRGPARVWSAVETGMFFSSQPKPIVIQPTPKAFRFAPQDFLCEAFLFNDASWNKIWI